MTAALEKAQQGEAYSREHDFAEILPSFLAVQATALLRTRSAGGGAPVGRSGGRGAGHEQISILPDLLLPNMRFWPRWMSGMRRWWH